MTSRRGSNRPDTSLKRKGESTSLSRKNLERLADNIDIVDDDDGSNSKKQSSIVTYTTPMKDVTKRDLSEEEMPFVIQLEPPKPGESVLFGKYYISEYPNESGCYQIKAGMRKGGLGKIEPTEKIAVAADSWRYRSDFGSFQIWLSKDTQILAKLFEDYLVSKKSDEDLETLFYPSKSNDKVVLSIRPHLNCVMPADIAKWSMETSKPSLRITMTVYGTRKYEKKTGLTVRSVDVRIVELERMD